MIFSMTWSSTIFCALVESLPRFFAACSWRKDSKAARAAFESFLQEQAAKKRGRLSTKAQKIVDDQVIEKIMAAYDRTHGEFEFEGMQVLWGSVDHGVMVEYDSEASARDGDAKA